MAKPPAELARAIGMVAKSTDSSFRTLVRIAKLDPSSDFKGADLSGVSLGYLDISTFDFTNAKLQGADLSRTVGFDSKNFKGADLTGALLPEQDDRSISLDRLVEEVAIKEASLYWNGRLRPLIASYRVQEEVESRVAIVRKVSRRSREHRTIDAEVDRELLLARQIGNPPYPILVCLPGTSSPSFRWKFHLLGPPFAADIGGKTKIRIGSPRNENQAIVLATSFAKGRSRSSALCGIIDLPFGVASIPVILDRIYSRYESIKPERSKRESVGPRQANNFVEVFAIALREELRRAKLHMTSVFILRHSSGHDF